MTNSARFSSTLQILLAKFDGQVLIPFLPAAGAIGLAEQTARNRLSAGTFPVQTVLNGSRRFVHIEDLANFIDSLRGLQTKKKRGAPLKKDRLAARAAQGVA
jgi:hypothetical protein